MISTLRRRAATRAARLTGLALAGALALTAAPLPDAGAAPPQVGPSDATLVGAWYSSFLGRPADGPSGYWVGQLRSASRPAVLTRLLRTPEEASTQVGAYYRDDLARARRGRGVLDVGGRDRRLPPGVGPPERPGLREVETGAFPLEWVHQNVLASAEFVARHGGTTTASGTDQVIIAWYAAILGRTDVGVDLATWRRELAARGALVVVRDIWYAPEAVQRRITAHYRDLLSRPAAPEELSFWCSHEVASDVDVQVAVASSAEYDRVGAARAVWAGMNPAQRAAQVVMVGVPASDPASGLYLVADDVVGGVFLAGRSSRGVAATGADVARFQSAAASRGLPNVLVSADEEGGQVQTLSGPGLPTIPSAVAQARLSHGDLAALTASWAGPLRSAGVNLNLGPIGDVVPAGTEAQNPPIGRYDRQFGSDPGAVAADVRTVLDASRGQGLLSTIKHFPGLGRVRANTDTSTGAVDTVTDSSSASLQPFRTAADDGVSAIMVSSASYPRLDGSNLAVFSPAIIDGLLRTDLGFTGLVVTDDMGAAVAVAGVPTGQRAVRAIRSGATMVLTIQPGDLGPMEDALTATAAADPGFAAQLREASITVLATRMPTR